MLVDYARWDAEMRKRTDDGAEVRAHLEASARRGNEEAAARLAGPEFPEEMEYLWGWALELHGRSGVGMAGAAPLSFATVAAWSDLTGYKPDALEVEALLLLDAALLAGAVKDKDGN